MIEIERRDREKGRERQSDIEIEKARDRRCPCCQSIIIWEMNSDGID